jgi:hypothetical protein
MNSSRKIPLSIFVLVVFMGLVTSASAQEMDDQRAQELARIDRILQEMSDFLSSAESFGFTAREVIDEVEDGRRIQYSNSRSMLVRRPNRIAAAAHGDLVNRSFWYDGRSFTLLDREFNTYLPVPAPDTISDLFDAIAEQLEVVVPLGEMVSGDAYQAVTPLIQEATYLGLHQVGGIACHHLGFSQEDLDWQLWVEDGSTPVPRKIVIVYKQEEGIPQYATVISEWNFSIQTPDEVFQFTPPEGARKLDVTVRMTPEETAGP